MRLRADGLAWREVDGEVVALDLASSTYFTVNASAAALWKLLGEGCERAQLVLGLVDRYRIDEAQAASDVDAFLGMLRAHALVED